MQSRAILFGLVWYGNYVLNEIVEIKTEKTIKNTVRHWNRKLHYFKRLKQNYCWTRICGTKSGTVIRLNLWLRSKWMFRSRIHKTCNNNLNFVVPLRRAQRKWFKSYGKIPARIEVKQHVLLLKLMKNRARKFDIIETISESCATERNNIHLCFADTKNWINNFKPNGKLYCQPTPIQFPYFFFLRALFSSTFSYSVRSYLFDSTTSLFIHALFPILHFFWWHTKTREISSSVMPQLCVLASGEM